MYARQVQKGDPRRNSQVPPTTRGSLRKFRRDCLNPSPAHDTDELDGSWIPPSTAGIVFFVNCILSDITIPRTNSINLPKYGATMGRMNSGTIERHEQRDVVFLISFCTFLLALIKIKPVGSSRYQTTKPQFSSVAVRVDAR